MNNFNFSIIDQDIDGIIDEVSDLNKENFDLSIQPVKHKNSRNSLLKILDPLNPYSSPPVQRDIIDKNPLNETNLLDNSWNFLGSEDTILLPIDQKSDLLCEFENLENENDQSFNSQNLELSLETNEVPTDNLLNISPKKNFVDKFIHNKLKKYHLKKQNEWKMLENSLLNKIDQLKDEVDSKSLFNEHKEDETTKLLENKQMEINQLIHDHEIKVLVLLTEKNALVDKLESENKDKIKELKDEKELIINELLQENEENLEKLRLNHSTILLSKQEELDNLTKEKETLCQEIESLNSSKIRDKIVIDQYCDTIEEIVKQHETMTANISQDNRDMEVMLNKYLVKINSSNSVISAQLQNESVLREQLAGCHEKIEQLEIELNRKSSELDDNNDNFNQKIASMKMDFDRKLNRKEIKIYMLENTENNLKAELELRIKERDQLKDHLKKLLE